MSIYSKIIICFILSFSLHAQSNALCLGLGCTCNVVANAINLGNYGAIEQLAVQGTGTIDVTCGAPLLVAVVAYNVSVSQGNSANFANRRMTNGGSHINYNIYTDAGHTTVLGDGTGPTAVISEVYTTNLNEQRLTNHPIYLQVPGGQSPTPIVHTDNLNVTVTF